MRQRSLIMSQKPGDLIIGIPTLKGWAICEGVPPELNPFSFTNHVALRRLLGRDDIGWLGSRVPVAKPRDPLAKLIHASTILQ
jgi:hypothetical protein